MDSAIKENIEAIINKDPRARAGELVERPEISFVDLVELNQLIRAVPQAKSADDLKIEFSKANPFFINSLFGDIKAYKNAINPDVKKQKSNALHEKIKNTRAKSMAFYFYGLGNQEKSDYIASLSSADKFLLETGTISTYKDGYVSKRELNNNILPHFNKKLQKRAVAVVTDNNPYLSESQAQIIRSIGSGVFLHHDTNTSADFAKLKKSTPLPEDTKYNLFEEPSIFAFAKNSANLQSIAPQIEQKLAKAGVPPEAIQFMSYADFLDSISDGKSIKFDEIGTLAKLTPYQEFAKNIAEDTKTFNLIVKDMRENKVSEEYIELWKKSVKEDYNLSPDTQFLPEDATVPHKTGIHHNGEKIRYAKTLANPLEIANVSSLSYCVEYTKEEKTHDNIHIGDNRDFPKFRDGKLLPGTSPNTIAKGDVIVDEFLTYADGSRLIPENTAFFSHSKIITANYKGLDDLIIKKAPSRMRTKQQNIGLSI